MLNIDLGHFVNDCPTNQDPNYDRPPYEDYICKFCKKVGMHYYLFCPHNPDPNSIYRRRQAKQPLKGTLTSDRGLKRSPSPLWEVSEDNQRRKLSSSSAMSRNNRGYAASPETEYGYFVRSGNLSPGLSFRSISGDTEGTRGLYAGGDFVYFNPDDKAKSGGLEPISVQLKPFGKREINMAVCI